LEPKASARFSRAGGHRRLRLTKEGVGETSGQRLDRIFRARRAAKAGPAEETVFLRSVRVCSSDPQFCPGSAFALVESGPDVFADALVPVEPIAPGLFPFPVPNGRSIASGLRTVSRGAAAMVIGLPNRAVNRISLRRANPSAARLFAHRPPPARRSRLHGVHRTP
jgi:hypothetical protein